MKLRTTFISLIFLALGATMIGSCSTQKESNNDFNNETKCKKINKLNIEICGTNIGTKYSVSINNQEKKELAGFLLDCNEGKIKGDRNAGYDSQADIWAKESINLFCKNVNAKSVTRSKENKVSDPTDRTVSGTKVDCRVVQNSSLKICVKNDKKNFIVVFSDINNNDAILLTSGSCNGKDLKYKYDRKYLSKDNAERMMKETIEFQLEHCKSKLEFYPTK